MEEKFPEKIDPNYIYNLSDYDNEGYQKIRQNYQKIENGDLSGEIDALLGEEINPFYNGLIFEIIIDEHGKVILYEEFKQNGHSKEKVDWEKFPVYISEHIRQRIQEGEMLEFQNNLNKIQEAKKKQIQKIIQLLVDRIFKNKEALKESLNYYANYYHEEEPHY